MKPCELCNGAGYTLLVAGPASGDDWSTDDERRIAAVIRCECGRLSQNAILREHKEPVDSTP